ncbi:MAG: GNAT family N-acetyltransferase [Defluviitaleaceae bacterium]|nr:GNAT family N-acetyltransferase [Defluviitaleaceae bacterium]
MDIELEYLKHQDLTGYKTMLDDVFNDSQPLEHYQKYYQENHPTVKVVVAKKEGEIVGTITFVLIDTFTSPLDPKIEFSNFATTPAARGTDAATLLIQFVCDYAKTHGYQSINVNCFADAKRAHGFYEKMGFKKLDQMRFQLEVTP